MSLVRLNEQKEERKNEPEDTLPRSGYGSEMIRIEVVGWKLRETHVFRVSTKTNQRTSIR